MGQLGQGDSNTTNLSLPRPAQGLPANDPVTAIEAGYYGSMVLTASGRVWVWGSNQYGQLANGICTNSLFNGISSTPLEVMGLPDPAADPVKLIAAGAFYNIVMTASGEVWAWGDNRNGQFGNGSVAVCVPTPVQVTGLPSGLVALAPGFSHTLALTNSGKVYAWGSDFFGELGQGTFQPSLTPLLVNLPAPASAVAAGHVHSLAVVHGQAYAWGDGAAGQNGDGTNNDSDIPVAVQGLPAPLVDPVIAISAGEFHNLALTRSGKVFGWGSNEFGQVGDGCDPNVTNSCRDQFTAVRVVGLPPLDLVKAINAHNAEHSLALTQSGQVWAWGDNLEGQLGNGCNLNTAGECIGGDSGTAIQVQGLPDPPAIAISAADSGHSMALLEEPQPPPTMDLSKSLRGSRVGPNDQFTVQIRDSTGAVVSDETNATTTGSGATVTPGTGTTGVFTAIAGNTYELTEVSANGTSISNYTQTITCTDANGVQTGLPNDAAFNGSFEILPIGGAALSCTITNTAAATPTPVPTASPSQPGLPNTGARR